MAEGVEPEAERERSGPEGTGTGFAELGGGRTGKRKRAAQADWVEGELDRARERHAGRHN